MASTATGSKDEALRPSAYVTMLANESYRASKLSKATRFDAGRPVPELPLSGSESEAEVLVSRFRFIFDDVHSYYFSNSSWR
ncbi:hypothetical protein ACLKA6_016252 [Drosophila palustris]